MQSRCWLKWWWLMEYPQQIHSTEMTACYLLWVLCYLGSSGGGGSVAAAAAGLPEHLADKTGWPCQVGGFPVS